MKPRKPEAKQRARGGKEKLPFLLVNMAMTADGKITTANRAVSGFSSRRDQEHMLELRATVDAVMAGARTVDLNPVTMGPGSRKYRLLRKRRGMAEYNLRVVVTGSGSLDPASRIFKDKFSPVIVLATASASRKRLDRLRAVAEEVKICGRKAINFPKALAWLRRRWGVKRLLCEGGGELNDPLFRLGLVDELHLTVSPLIFGGRAAPTIVDGAGVGRLSRAIPLRLGRARRHGDEMYYVFSPPARKSIGRHRTKTLGPAKSPALKTPRGGRHHLMAVRRGPN